MIYTDYDDSYDVRQLQKLPMYQGMSERDIRHVMTTVATREREQWEDEVRAMLLDQKQKTLAYIEEIKDAKKLPSEPVKIHKGVRIYPSLIDDQGFVSEDTLHNQKKTIRLSLDDKRKIYL